MVVDSLPKAKQVYLAKTNRITEYKIIREFNEDKGWAVSSICGILEISRSAYYKWLNKKPSEKELEDQKIVDKIKEIADSNNSLFGTEKMTYVLKLRHGFTCGHNRVYRLMCINDISSSFRKTARYKYKKSEPEETAENLLGRDFDSENINEKWCSDVTEIKVPETGEKLYMSPVLDLCDRYPVGLAVSDRNDCALTDKALAQALENNPGAKPLYHTDRGFQYTRKVFKTLLESNGMTQSMSRVSRCIDNGPCEEFQGLIKDMMKVLYPDARTKNEIIEAIYGTVRYYIEEYPQARFNGKTCGQVRAEALNNDNSAYYPIKKDKRYIDFWNNINQKKQRDINEDQ